MSAFLGATLRPGVEIVTDALRLRDAIRGASLVVTGEGRIDGQTLRGKAPIGVARIAAECGVPVVAIGGAVTHQAGALYAHGFDAVFASVGRACTIDEALRDAAANVARAAAIRPPFVLQARAAPHLVGARAGGRGAPLRRRRFARVAARSPAWFGERGYVLSSFQ